MSTKVSKRSVAQKRVRARRAATRVLGGRAPDDAVTRRLERGLARMQQMSDDELSQIAVRAGIYTEDGKLTAPYRSTEPSAYRPRD